MSFEYIAAQISSLCQRVFENIGWIIFEGYVNKLYLYKIVLFHSVVILNYFTLAKVHHVNTGRGTFACNFLVGPYIVADGAVFLNNCALTD
jgi:hypothetical protein